MKTILVPLDFSAVSRSVVIEAVKLARAMDADLVLLHSVAPPPVIATDLVPIVDRSLTWTRQAEKSANRHLRSVQRVLTKRGLRVEAICLTGYAVTNIQAQMKALPASYVVMGSHGHTAFYDLVTGSTTSGVLKRALCPVVVVPAGKGKVRRGTRAPQQARPPQSRTG